MKAKSYAYILVLIFSAGACVSPPDNFPTVPEISYEGLSYLEVDGASDSLKVAINFRDAEGDLGLDPREDNPPYNPLFFLTDENGDYITYSNRPEDAPSYNPRDWAVEPTINNETIEDTLWVEHNPDYYNIFVRFFIKRNGTFNEFKWTDAPYYTTFDGRFPLILNDNNQRAVEGTIEYAMLSSGWRSIFRNDTVRLDLQIQDRALNKSNVISTPEFTLNQIQQQ
ncbi:hypothetical protein [Echinicola vietnamensis]|uniref:Lipoprotein n=1 Tax=Echinicola vietnamensis (strain DSM 17526 / LMG 23754 / KMM 6221) TaxID=926556 RepID=L0FV05_ECHVK|nr:hypothetical protein [Echinicola vietnamensis]AGA76495.1 hypothetical protein Echvi_0199 [Echinicola vietnamensis DSM 17526]